MAAGDVVSNIASTAASAFLDMQPASGVEWVIHNISYEGDIELYFYDGTNSIKVDSDLGAGSMRREALHCTNSKYYRVKNIAATAKLLGYDGVQTK